MSTDIPTSMKALVVETFGPPEALKYSTVPVPKLTKSTDILIRVVAASVNPIDAKLRSGMAPLLVKKNAIIGGDYSGIVAAKGADVSGFEIGDAVFGTIRPGALQGSYAEYVVINTASDKGIAKKPDNISFADAAALGVAALTALLAVVLKAPLPLKYDGQGPRPKVLVIGASGGVGLFGVQIGKAIGASVTGICSNKNASLVKSMGADLVVDYNDAQAMADLTKEDQFDTYDVVFDLVGGPDYYNKCLPLVKKKTGVFASSVGPVAHFGSSKVGVLDYLSVGAILAYRHLFARRRYTMTLNLPTDKLATDITYLLEQKLIKPYILDENVFTLEDGYKAHQQIESHRTIGKIILNISPDNFNK